MKKFEIKKILVPTDFSETAANALRQAIYIAKANNASIKLVHVISTVYITGSELTVPYSQAFFSKLEKSSKAYLKKIVDDNKKSKGPQISFEVKMGSTETVINYIAEKEKFSLIVMGTHGTSGLKEFFIGSNAYKVVANAPCPVITVQKKTKPGFKNIILPIRLDTYSRQKVDYVVEIAKFSGAKIYITGFTSGKDKSNKNKLALYVKQVEKYLSKQGLDYSSTSIYGDNFIKEMLDYAKRNKADLIAVMNDNDFSLDQIIAGPYAKQFVNHSDIPVMSIPVYSNPDWLESMPYLSGSTPG